MMMKNKKSLSEFRRGFFVSKYFYLFSQAIGQYNHFVLDHFHHAAFDMKGIRLIIGSPYDHFPAFQSRNDRSVVFQNLESTSGARYSYRVNISFKYRLVGGVDF